MPHSEHFKSIQRSVASKISCCKKKFMEDFKQNWLSLSIQEKVEIFYYLIAQRYDKKWINTDLLMDALTYCLSNTPCVMGVDDQCRSKENIHTRLSGTTGYTALMCAVSFKDMKVINILLTQVSKEDCKNQLLSDETQEGYFPLLIACYHDQLEIVKLLLNHYPDEQLLKQDRNQKYNALMIAGMRGCHLIVNQILTLSGKATNLTSEQLRAQDSWAKATALEHVALSDNFCKKMNMTDIQATKRTIIAQMVNHGARVTRTWSQEDRSEEKSVAEAFILGSYRDKFSQSAHQKDLVYTDLCNYAVIEGYVLSEDDKAFSKEMTNTNRAFLSGSSSSSPVSPGTHLAARSLTAMFTSKKAKRSKQQRKTPDEPEMMDVDSLTDADENNNNVNSKKGSGQKRIHWFDRKFDAETEFALQESLGEYQEETAHGLTTMFQESNSSSRPYKKVKYDNEFLQALKDGNIKEAMEIIENRLLIDIAIEGETPIIHAIRSKKTRVINKILQQDPNLEVKSLEGKTPLQLALENNCDDAVINNLLDRSGIYHLENNLDLLMSVIHSNSISLFIKIKQFYDKHFAQNEYTMDELYQCAVHQKKHIIASYIKQTFLTSHRNDFNYRYESPFRHLGDLYYGGPSHFSSSDFSRNNMDFSSPSMLPSFSRNRSQQPSFEQHMSRHEYPEVDMNCEFEKYGNKKPDPI